MERAQQFLCHALASYVQNVGNKYFVFFAGQFVLSVQLIVIETEHLLYCVYVCACSLTHPLRSYGRRKLAVFSSVLSKINKRAKRNGAHEIKASDRKQ